MIKFAGATKNASEKINVHCADFDLFTGLSWLHSLCEMQHNACAPSLAEMDSNGKPLPGAELNAFDRSGITFTNLSSFGFKEMKRRLRVMHGFRAYQSREG